MEKFFWYEIYNEWGKSLVNHFATKMILDISMKNEAFRSKQILTNPVEVQSPIPD